MADFCKQCSEEKFGSDYKELAGLGSPESNAKGLYAVVICEGCCNGSGVFVDFEGRCVTPDCAENHGAEE